VETDEPNFVEYSCADKIATITLNRPDKLNAVSDEVVRQLDEALHRFGWSNQPGSTGRNDGLRLTGAYVTDCG